MNPLERKTELFTKVSVALALHRKVELADRITVKSGNPYRQAGRFAPKTGGTPPPKAQTPPGLVQQGNIDINNRPVVLNPETGEISTVRSITVTDDDGRAYILPTVSDDGRIVSNEEAIDIFRKTGKHLGIFDNEENATSFAEKLHLSQEKQYAAKGKEVIKKFQADLVKKGAKIKVDGMWGPKTEAAYKSFGKKKPKVGGPMRKIVN